MRDLGEGGERAGGTARTGQIPTPPGGTHDSSFDPIRQGYVISGRRSARVGGNTDVLCGRKRAPRCNKCPWEPWRREA